MAYTPLTLTCVDYLSRSQGLTNTRRAEFLSRYTNLSVVKAANELINSGGATLTVNFPALVNLKQNGTLTGLTQYVIGYTTTTILDAGVPKFTSAWSMANGYIAQINEVVKATKDSASQNAVFKGNDAAMTGNLSLVSSDLKKFASDLANTGELFDTPVDPYSNPVRVARKILKANGRTFLLPSLLNNGLTQSEVDLIESDDTVDNIVAKKLYTAFTKVDKETLTSVLQLLSIKTTGLTTLADVFDLKKMFPTSYTTLKANVKPGIKDLFGKTPVKKDDLFTVPDIIISEELTVQLAAFAASMQKIVNINNLTIASVAKTASTMESSAGLSAVSAATSAVSAATASNLNSSFAVGTGKDNTLVLADVLGLTVGYSHYDLFNLVADDLTQLEPYCAKLISLLHSAAIETVPATKASYVTQAQNEVNAIYAAHKTIADRAQANWDKILKRINNEATRQSAAGIAAGSLSGTQQNILAFAQGLHKVGEDTIPGGQRNMLEQLASTDAAGQTIIACMKEGQNIKQMQQNGLSTTNFI